MKTGATRTELLELARRIEERGLQFPSMQGPPYTERGERREGSILPVELLTDYEVTVICAALLTLAETAP
jgi:hypothetical protein